MKKYFLIKLLVVCIFMYSAYMICDLTKYYIVPVDYSDDKIRVVINDAEITKGVKNDVIIRDGKVLFSIDAIKQYFDKYIYFDEKYQTVIVTGEKDVLQFKLNENKMKINGIEKNIETSAIMMDEKIYVPLEELQELYEIKIENNEKIVVTTSTVNYTRFQMTQKANAKLYKRETSLTTGEIKPQDVITILAEYPS